MIKKFEEFVKSTTIKEENFTPEVPKEKESEKTKGKHVSGLKEVIEIVGIGKMKAKLDSGNTAMNALILQSYDENDDKVKFSLDGKEYEFDVIDHINIWHHGKSTTRPVIKVDIKFHNTIYKDEKINLKISDLTGTKNYRSRMLLCKQFMSRANIIIDPSKEFELTDEDDLPKKHRTKKSKK